MEILPNIYSQMRANFDGLLKRINRTNTDKLLDWLDKHHFYAVPASIRFHNAFKHGLLKHSLEVCNEGLAIYHEYSVKQPDRVKDFSKESVAVCCLLHDICKWNNYYISPKDATIKCNYKAKNQGHGLKSVRILEEIGYPLSDQEKLAIQWHMGKDHEPSYKDDPAGFNKSLNDELSRLIRRADHDASKMKERFEDLIRSLNLTNGDRLIHYLDESSFYQTCCGSHHKYPGGLVAHSLGTYRHIMEICTPAEQHDAAIIALLHDIAMQDRSHYYSGHGMRSKMILERRLQMNLSDDVLNMIRFHKNSKRLRPYQEQLLLTQTRQIPLHAKLVESDHFDAYHDLTDVLKHYSEW